MSLSIKKQLNDRELVAAGRLFASGVLRKIAQKSDFSEFLSIFHQMNFDFRSNHAATVAEAYDYAFERLRKSGARNEYVYKAALTHNVLLGIHSLSTASMATEFRSGKSKADVVIFNGTSTAYEIKSDRDNLVRLSKQISDYRKTFARNFVVCAPTHVAEVQNALPHDVGILLLSRWNRISTYREASSDLSRLCLDTIFSSLTTKEASKALDLCGKPSPDVPNTRMRRELRNLFASLDVGDAHSAVVATLRNTRSKESLGKSLHNLPKSVMPAVLTLRLKMSERNFLAESMRRKIVSL